MYTPQRASSISRSPSQSAQQQALMPAAGRMATSSESNSPRQSKKPAWREVHEKVLTDRGLWREDPSSQAQVSYAVGVRSLSSQPLPTEQAGKSPAVQCPHCGNTYLWDAVYCRHCGHKRDVAEQHLGLRRSLGRASSSTGRIPGSADRSENVSPSAVQVEPVTSRNGSANRSQELQIATVAAQDVDTVASSRDSLKSLAAERDRLRSQVSDMRHDVSNARQDLTSQHERQKLQTEELRHTLQDLQADAERLQIEQRKAAASMKNASKGGTGDSSRLEKQVEGVASIVASQDKRFDRLEHELTAAYDAQRAQLQEALAQNRNLAKGLEEEGNRRAKAMLEMVDKVTKNNPANQLSTELASATAAIQGQSSDWADLSRSIRSEVSGLATQMKADRDSRALESASQRNEILKMVEDARRHGAMEVLQASQARGLPDLHGISQDMISRPGVSAVQNMIDVNSKILFDMESQLIVRAGFIAGVFHTWRCEATLWKTGRRYQDEFSKNQDEWEAHLAHHVRSFQEDMVRAAEEAAARKEHVRLQHDLLLEQWALGEAKGLFSECMRAWHEHVVKDKNLRRIAANIQKATYQWAQGDAKGLLHACFAAWHSRTREDADERRHQQEMEDAANGYQNSMNQALTAAEQRIHDGVVALEKAKCGGTKGIEMMIAKWAKGSEKGNMTMCFKALAENRVLCRRKDGQRKSVEMMVKKWLGGKAKGVLQMIWVTWKKDALDSKRFDAEKKQMIDLLDNERAKQEREWREIHDVQKRKTEAAHQAVQLVLKKWQLGDVEGLKNQVFYAWRVKSLKTASDNRRLQSVHMALAKFARGEAKGALQISFLNWKQDAMTAAEERRAQAVAEGHNAHIDELLADANKRHENELAKHMSEAERRLDAAKAAVMKSVEQWGMGDKKGLAKSVMQNWHRYVAEVKREARQRQAVHAALAQSFAGGEKAALKLAFQNWLSLTQSESAERKGEDMVSKEREKWEAETDRMRKLYEEGLRGHVDEQERLRAQAHATTELMLKKWLGDKKGEVSEYFTLWRRLIAAIKQANHKRAATKDAMMRFLEGESRGIKHSIFTNWLNYVIAQRLHQAAIDKLEKQVEHLLSKHELHLQKYSVFMANKSEPALKGLVLNAWKEVSQGERYLELEREREVQLEELQRQNELAETSKKEARARVLDSLGMKDSKIFLMEIFLAWSYLWQQGRQERIHKMNANKELQKFSEYMLLKHLKKDDKALLTSSFSEWRREGKILRHLEAMQQLDETQVYITQLKAGFEEQLAMAYQQIDHITETLQKELQTKEDMAQELREAYDKMRKNMTLALPDFTGTGTPGNGTPGGSRLLLRPSSAGSRSHSVGSVAGCRSARNSAPAQAAETCPNCGNIYAADAIFCRKCGQKRDQGTPSDAELPPSRSVPGMEPTTSLPRTPTGLASRGRGATLNGAEPAGSGAIPGAALTTQPLLYGLNGTRGSSRGSSPARPVDWPAVVERLEERGDLHITKPKPGLRF